MGAPWQGVKPKQKVNSSFWVLDISEGGLFAGGRAGLSSMVGGCPLPRAHASTLARFNRASVAHSGKTVAR